MSLPVGLLSELCAVPYLLARGPEPSWLMPPPPPDTPPLPHSQMSPPTLPLLDRWCPKRKRKTCPPDPWTLHPTLSSWLRNMDTLSTLIVRLHELATTAPQEYQPQLKSQVIALRIALDRQQKRCMTFLRLTGKYADKFLSDITEEIQQQSSFLTALERRLAMANNLREQVVHLQKSYDDGTLDCIKKVRRTVLSQPLPQDIDLFKEMDGILKEIHRCYLEMDRFWVDEVCRVTKALEDRRLDPEDIDRWRRFQESLKQIITGWETRSAESGRSAVVTHINPQLSVRHSILRIVCPL
ncbi:hypothetical protein BJV78DRAFT_1242913 [Lactifluus subvellereus]|nr:hypothetical protein BJV78DRAFT_1242913 [Lactifluus subvellereus]